MSKEAMKVVAKEMMSEAAQAELRRSVHSIHSTVFSFNEHLLDLKKRYGNAFLEDLEECMGLIEGELSDAVTIAEEGDEEEDDDSEEDGEEE